jgi:hypothetical protein
MDVMDTRPQTAEPLPAVASAVRNAVFRVPTSAEPASDAPRERARELTRAAARRAAMVSAAYSLPPGPFGLATILPDLIQVWRIQNQLVADIAGAYGRRAALTPEMMAYCLFRHAAAQAVRDLVVRAGGRMVVKAAGSRLVPRIATGLSQRLAGRTATRFLPVAGTIGVGAYAFYDTTVVGRTAARLMETGLVVAPPDAPEDTPAEQG